MHILKIFLLLLLILPTATQAEMLEAYYLGQALNNIATPTSTDQLVPKITQLFPPKSYTVKPYTTDNTFYSSENAKQAKLTTGITQYLVNSLDASALDDVFICYDNSNSKGVYNWGLVCNHQTMNNELGHNDNIKYDNTELGKQVLITGYCVIDGKTFNQLASKQNMNALLTAQTKKVIAKNFLFSPPVSLIECTSNGWVFRNLSDSDTGLTLTYDQLLANFDDLEISQPYRKGDFPPFDLNNIETWQWYSIPMELHINIKCKNNKRFREMLKNAINIKLIRDVTVSVDMNPETML